MNASFERTLVDVWRQVLVENAKVVELREKHYPVRLTAKRRLRQVDFAFDGNELQGLEQNPDTKSRRGQMARAGKKVMQFLSEGRYLANVVDGKVNVRRTLYDPGRQLDRNRAEEPYRAPSKANAKPQCQRRQGCRL